MKIVQVEAIPLRLPVKHKLRVSGGTYHELHHVLVKLHTDQGVTGIGEVEASTAFDRWGADSQEGVTAVVEKYLAPVLVGENPFNVELIWRKMDEAVKGHLRAKSGIDLALYDLLGRALGVPAYELLGGAVRLEAPVEGVGYGISIDEPEKMAAVAKWAVDRGYTEIELKAGDPVPERDLERLRVVREAIGPKPTIKIDFNAGNDVRTVIRLIKQMERYSIQWVEQPVEFWDLEGLVRIRNSIDTPLIVDETVNTPQDMINVVRAGAADAVHIKPTIKCGLTGSKRIYAIAEAAGVMVIPGTLVPTGVGMAAAYTFLASCRYIHRGMHGSPLELLEEDVVKDPVPPGQPVIKIPSRPGLGFELDDAQVERFRIRSDGRVAGSAAPAEAEPSAWSRA